MRERLAVLVEQIYNSFYQKFYKRPHWKLDGKLNKNSIQIQNFIDLLAKHYQLDSININFLINYLAWSFNRRYGQITKREISLNWIIGKKTLEQFLKRKDGEQYFVDQFANNIGINIEQLRYELHEKGVEVSGLDPAEELEKDRFSGGARLYNCLQYTTLYNHRSKSCLTCDNKLICKKLLKSIFPRTYKKRGYTE